MILAASHPQLQRLFVCLNKGAGGTAPTQENVRKVPEFVWPSPSRAVDVRWTTPVADLGSAACTQTER